MTNLPLILCSSSPARRALLARLTSNFKVLSPEIDETPKPQEIPHELVTRLSIEKATALAPQHPNSLIIGADQVGVFKDQILGKPYTKERAIAQLQRVSGKSIVFYSGIALLNTATQRIQTAMVPTTVKMRILTLSMIENYLDKEQPYACAGSCQIEGLGITLVEEMISTDYTALIGLPLIKLTQLLEKENYFII